MPSNHWYTKLNYMKFLNNIKEELTEESDLINLLVSSHLK